jgi:hypothetical protein
LKNQKIVRFGKRFLAFVLAILNLGDIIMNTMENTISLFRMKTGEDVLAKATTTDKNGIAGYMLKDAMALVATPDGRLAFIGWMPFADKNSLFVPNDFVWFTAEPEKEILNQYVSFSSGLVMPSNKKVEEPKLQFRGAE